MLTIHVVDLEEELQFVHLRPIGEDGETVHQLLEADGAVAILVKELKEAVGEEALKGDKQQKVMCKSCDSNVTCEA